jgi:acetylornithine/N-succinyldiaminopimelate aminotransferase
VVDEVQSGIGRTGSWFASLAAGVTPDIITLAKGLGGGMPVGACVGISPAAANAMGPGSHGSTFGGNPVSCAAALAVLDTIARDGLLDNARTLGIRLAGGLRSIASPLVAEVRGRGLWLGVALTRQVAAEVEAAAREQGLLINAVKADVLRLAPPLVVSAEDVDSAVSRLAVALAAVDNHLEQVR